MLESDDAPPPSGAEETAKVEGLNPEELFARGMQSVKMSYGGGGAQGWVPPSDEEMARLFPQYEMLGMLGRGGMGAVYKARQIELDRCVAIKLLPLEISVDKDFADRFRREARAMAKLNHPNIIAVYDFGTTAEGHLYFVMEFVEGANLHQLIHSAGLDPDQALALAGQVCTALAYAHGKGIVHRDIKPANVMVDTEGQAKVADFGLARLTDPSSDAWGNTMTGTVMGTPDYMAPEQMKGMHVDHRADIYSVGVMIYEMLCKEAPRGIFDPPSQRVGCDARIDQIVIRAMHQSPERRYQSTQEMKTDVDAARTPLVVAAPRARAVAAPPPKPRAVPRPAATPAPGVAAPSPAKKRKPPLLLYGGLSLVLVAAAVIAIFASSKPKPPGPKPAERPSATGAPPAPRSAAPLEPGAIRLWDAREKLPALSGVSWEDGALCLNKVKVEGGPISRDGILRALTKLNPGAEQVFSLRHTGSGTQMQAYYLKIETSGQVALRMVTAGKTTSIRTAQLARAYAPNEWARIEFRIVGGKLTARIDDQTLEATDDRIAEPGVAMLGTSSKGYFRDIVYVPLDKAALPALGAAAKPSSTTPPARGRTIDLLRLVEVTRDALKGRWSVGPDALSLDTVADFGVLEFPYEPPESYDFEIEFTPTNQGNNVNQYLTAAGHAFAWKLNAHARTPPLYGFELLDGKFSKDLKEAAVEKPLALIAGQRMTSTVKVRRDGLQALVNGEEFVKWRGDFARFSMEAGTKLRNERALGIGSYKRTVIFHRALVREITGTGRITAPSSPTPP